MQHTFEIASGAWEIDDNGFLRIKTRVLSAGVMAYTRAELGDSVPNDVVGDVIYLAVLPDTLAEPRAIRSLEGMPVTVGHTWQEPGDNSSQVGSHAGTPIVEGPYLVVDMLLTDPAAIKRVMDRELVDLSSSYDMDILWGNGVYDGQPFHGVQTRLRYNHTALLPPGTGRAGRDVRVLNHKPEATPMTVETTLVSLPHNVRVRVANEDAAKVAEAVDKAKEDGEKTAATAFNQTIETIKTELSAALEAKKAADAVVDELKAQIKSLTDQIAEVSSPEAVEAKIEEISNERDDAAKIMNAKTLPDDLRKLSGHALRTEVITRHRAANKMPELAADQLKDEVGVKARFQTLRELVGTSAAKVPQSEPVKTRVANAAPTNYAQSRLTALYGSKKEA